MGATRCSEDWAASRSAARPGAMVVFNGPSSAGKSTLVKAVQERLAARGGLPVRRDDIFLRVAYDDLDLMCVLLLSLPNISCRCI